MYFLNGSSPSGCIFSWQNKFSNYSSVWNYFKQLEQQVDRLLFWSSSHTSFINPRLLFQDLKKKRWVMPRTTATNQKCILVKKFTTLLTFHLESDFILPAGVWQENKHDILLFKPMENLKSALNSDMGLYRIFTV